MQGLVLKSTGSWYNVRDNNGKIHHCRIVGKFRTKGLKSTNPIAVGDFVDFELEDDESGIIFKIHNRNNYIIRRSVNLSKQTHIIAANLDQAILVTSLKSPRTSLGFIDRFLITAEAYRIPTVIVFNKYDLLGEDEKKELKEIRATYANIGYQSYTTSIPNDVGLEEMHHLLKDKTTLLSGHSGVGKSTLVNKIEPTLDLKTQEVSDSHNKGQHTTTFAEMHELSFGGFLIDTPGIKGFGLVDMEKEEIQDYFPEIFALKSQCKFNNCMHLNEPKCAVKEAYAEGKIAESRFQNYINFIENEDESPYRKDIYS